MYIHPQKYRDGGCVNVSNYSSLATVKELRNKLGDHEKALFRKSAVGHLLDMPPEQSWSATLFAYIMSREVDYPAEPGKEVVKVDRKAKGEDSEDESEEEYSETWFRVCDKTDGFGKVNDPKKKCLHPSDRDLCFGKREFAFITGLSFRKPEKAFKCPEGPSILQTKFFANISCVKGFHLRTFIYNKDTDCSAEERVKVALLFFVHLFLLGHAVDHTIERKFWHLVDNLQEFNQYPWGEVVYGRTIAKNRRKLHFQTTRYPENLKVTIKSVGLPQALVVRGIFLI